MAYGFLDTSYIDYPPGVDTDYIANLKSRDGITFDKILQQINSMLREVNGGLPLDLAMLVSQTTDPIADTTSATAFFVEKGTERTVSRPQVGEEQANMLPIDQYDVSTGYTEDMLKQMPSRKIYQQMRGMVNGWKRLHRVSILTRLFSIDEIPVDKRITALSPGFAGSGTGNNVYTGNYPDGTALGAGYTHYARIASAGLAAGIDAGVSKLDRFYDGPYHMTGSVAAIDLVKLLPKFVAASTDLIRLGSASAEALVDAGQYVGVYDGKVLVHKPFNDTTETYLSIFKSQGAMADGNPLAWRWDELYGRNAYIAYRSLFPLDQAVMKQKFGIGVSNRLAAYNILIAAAGAYVNPTFSR